MKISRLLTMLAYVGGGNVYVFTVAAGFVNRASNTALRKSAYENALMLTGALPSEL